jgi:hypothetical protein
VLNRFAVKGVLRRMQGMVNENIYSQARFFSVWELKQMVHELLGDVPLSWRTVGQLPAHSGKLSRRIENSDLIQRCPFGAFAGMVVTLMPRYRTRPLELTLPRTAPAFDIPAIASGCRGFEEVSKS